jgi:competence protein ComEC
VYATVTVGQSTKVGSKDSLWIIRFVRQVRTQLLQTIENIYPKQSAKLLSGLLIGERADLSVEIKTAFNRAGLTHIIAVSGFNITIILIFLSFLFRPFPMHTKLLLAFVSIGFFTLIVGPQISVLRASVFGLVAYSILLSGQQMRAFSLLMAIATGFVIIDPLILNYDVSFHLSFLAVFGLLFFGDFFTRIFSFFPKWFGLRESLAMCFAALIFTLPIIIVNFGILSIIAPLTNIVVVPFIPLIMLGGFLSMIVSLFSHTIAIIIGFPTWLGLEYILRSVTFF